LNQSSLANLDNQPHLTIKGLETTFFTKLGNIKAVDNLSYSINKGKILGIVGESGCGKSVTAYSIMRLLDHPGKVTAGQAFLGKDDILLIPEKDIQDIRGNKIAMIFQEPMTALNPVLTIGHQMDEQIKKHLELNKTDTKDHAIHMLTQVGISSPEIRYHNYPHQLSGGMRQRAMIAMALSCNPEFLIADEPTTALDVTVQAQILDLIQCMQQKLNMSVQFITHDLGVISELADQVLVMYAGRACELADTETILNNPRHPYTQALLNSVPKFRARVSRLPTIEGSVPSPLELPSGCNFLNRCPHVRPICHKKKPELKTISPTHHSACFLEEG